MGKRNKKWKKFELLVHKIQSDLSPGAIVKYDVRLLGYKSRAKRQIDILVEQNVGPQKIRVVVECKDYGVGKVVTGPDIEGFVKKLEDVRAHKGVVVSGTGFSSSAIALGEAYDVDLMEVVDAEQHEWTRLVGVPVVAEFATVLKTSFVLAGGKEVDELAGQEHHVFEVYDWMQNLVGTTLEIFARQWNAGMLPEEIGDHSQVLLTKLAPGYVFHKGKRYEVHIYANYHVEGQLFLGELPIINARGFWNVQKQALVVSSDSILITGIITPQQIDSWPRIENIAALKRKPVILIKGKHGFTKESITTITNRYNSHHLG
jgi:hypothetical protein